MKVFLKSDTHNKIYFFIYLLYMKIEEIHNNFIKRFN